MCRYTEKPNRYWRFWQTDTETDVGIWQTENTAIRQYRIFRYSLIHSGDRCCSNFETRVLMIKIECNIMHALLHCIGLYANLAKLTIPQIRTSLNKNI